MSVFYRAFGPPVVLTAPLTIGLSITGNPGPFTLNHVDAAYPIIGAGATVDDPVLYRYTDFLIEVWRKLRQWIFDAGVAQGLTPVGTVQDVELTLEVTFPDNQNEVFDNQVRVSLSIPAAGLGFTGATITSAFVINDGTGGTSFWCPYLGLTGETDGNKGFLLSSGVFTAAGEFQPRYFTVILRSEQDSGEYEERQDYTTRTLGDGSVVAYNFGFAEVRRDLRVVSLMPGDLAPQFHLGPLKEIDVTRTILSFPNPDTTGANGSGVIGLGSTPPGLQTDRLAVGDYVRVAEQWVGRVKDISNPAPGVGDIDVELYDVIPDNIEPAEGAPIYLISGMHALILESLRLDGLFVYDVDDTTGEFRASGPLYKIRGAGKLLLKFERQNPQASDLYNFMLNLVRSSNPGLTMVS